MKDQTIEIPTRAGRMETFVSHPEQGGPFPPVILYMDVWGVRDVLFDLARRVAAVGYYVLVPDFYYRQGRIRSDFRDENGRAISITKLSPELREKVLVPMKKLSDEMVMEDTADIFTFLDGQNVVKAGAAGCFGYCMGGRHVLQAAARFPGRFKASASLHGTYIISDQPDSPHLATAKMQGEVYCGFAETDPFAPMSMVGEFGQLMKTSTARYSVEVHPGAEHGYALPDRDVYLQRAAERDWEMMFAMFFRKIPPAFQK